MDITVSGITLTFFATDEEAWNYFHANFLKTEGYTVEDKEIELFAVSGKAIGSMGEQQVLAVRDKDMNIVRYLGYRFKAENYDEELIKRVKSIVSPYYNYAGPEYYTLENPDEEDFYYWEILGRAKEFKEFTPANTSEEEWRALLVQQGLDRVKRIDRVYRVLTGKDYVYIIDEDDIEFAPGELEVIDSEE